MKAKINKRHFLSNLDISSKMAIENLPIWNSNFSESQ